MRLRLVGYEPKVVCQLASLADEWSQHAAAFNSIVVTYVNR